MVKRVFRTARMGMSNECHSHSLFRVHVNIRPVDALNEKRNLQVFFFHGPPTQNSASKYET